MGHSHRSRPRLKQRRLFPAENAQTGGADSIERHREHHRVGTEHEDVGNGLSGNVDSLGNREALGEISGQVSGYAYDPGTQTGAFTLSVASNAALRRMNSGLLTITVRRVPVTYLQNNPTFGDGDTVKVRGLLFADPLYNNSNYHPPDPIKFILVADRISK